MKRIFLYLSTLLLVFFLIVCTPKQLLIENKNSNSNQEKSVDEDEANKVDQWTINEYKNPNGGEYAMLGKHEGRYFTIILRYPGEYAEGFVPRANKIIDHLYWTDTNKYLVEP